jgi:glycerophosphoryl diester phosphodiesterase
VDFMTARAGQLRAERPARPRIIAHRGASADVAEHTLAAYRKAIDDGADGLECDVRLTRDGVLVCVHDRTVDRTSSGWGSVSTLELAELSELDFGSWRDPGAGGERPDRDLTGVVTLARLLSVVTDSPRPLELAIETKHPTRYAGLVESTLVALLRAHGLVGGRHQVRVMSFSTVGLSRVRTLAPELRTVLLCKRIPIRARYGRLPVVADIAGPSLAALRAVPDWVARCHARGHEVHVWTVDEPADVSWVAELGVDAVITNRPAQALAQLA